MTSVWLGRKLVGKTRRDPKDPRMLANENKGQAFKSSVDGKHYVSIDPPTKLTGGK